MPAPSPVAVTLSHPAFTVTLADFGTVTVRFTFPFELLCDWISTALPLTVTCAATLSKIFFASASELAYATSCACTSSVRLVARGNAHVAARNLNLNRRVSRNLPAVDRLVAVVLRHSEGVEEIVVAERPEGPPEVVVCRRQGAHNGQHDRESR